MWFITLFILTNSNWKPPMTGKTRYLHCPFLKGCYIFEHYYKNIHRHHEEIFVRLLCDANKLKATKNIWPDCGCMMHYLYQTLTMPLMQVLVSLTSCLLFNLQLMTVLKIKFCNTTHTDGQAITEFLRSYFGNLLKKIP